MNSSTALIRWSNYLYKKAAPHPQQKTAKLPPRLFITDHETTKNIEQVIKSLPKNTGVIIRDYKHTDRKNYAEAVAKICKKQKRIFLIAKDEALARKLKANGVHFPEGYLPRINKIKKKNSNWLITAATHSLKTIKKHESSALPTVTAWLLSPVFPTKTHIERKPLGLIRTTRIIQNTRQPVYVLGGISKKNSKKCKMTNAVGIAAIRAFLSKKLDQ